MFCVKIHQLHQVQGPGSGPAWKTAAYAKNTGLYSISEP